MTWREAFASTWPAALGGCVGSFLGVVLTGFRWYTLLIPLAPWCLAAVMTYAAALLMDRDAR